MEAVSIGSPLLWAGFVGFVLVMLALDLGVFHRKAHAVPFKEAAAWSGVWIALAMLFNAWIYWKFGTKTGTEFLTGYLVEKSLSIDNIFVFVVIFSAFSIPAVQQHRVLYWGVLGALLMRAAMIFAGTALLNRFHFLIYVFGAFLVFTGFKLFLHRNQEQQPEKSLALRLTKRLVPSTDRFDGQKFFTRENGRRVATPLFLALVLVEVTDLVFAVDSIPAIFAITRDPFLVFTSNIFAILGLRSLFFMLAGLVDRFVYLKVGLAAVLVFVGVKMTLVDVFKVPPPASLAIIVLLLGGSIVASLRRTRAVAGAAGSGLPPV